MSLILSGTDGLSDVDGSAATPAIRGTDANTGIFFPAADTIAFAEGGAEVARFDSSGNFGLGVTPNAWGGSYKALQFSSGCVASYSNSQMTIGQNFYDDGAGSYKYVNTASATRYLQSGLHYWYVAASGTAGSAITWTQAMTLNANGALALSGASTTATGVGITFPATQSASSDANTLDDYEEGTFTPSITAGMTGITYVTQAGNYTKIGNLVVASCAVRISAATTNGSDLTIGGLPFTVSNATGSVWSGGVHYNSLITSGTGGICVTVQPNSTTTKFNSFTGSTYLGNNCASIGYLYFMVVYQAS